MSLLCNGISMGCYSAYSEYFRGSHHLLDILEEVCRGDDAMPSTDLGFGFADHSFTN